MPVENTEYLGLAIHQHEEVILVNAILLPFFAAELDISFIKVGLVLLLKVLKDILLVEQGIAVVKSNLVFEIFLNHAPVVDPGRSKDIVVDRIEVARLCLILDDLLIEFLLDVKVVLLVLFFDLFLSEGTLGRVEDVIRTHHILLDSLQAHLLRISLKSTRMRLFASSKCLLLIKWLHLIIGG